MTNPVELKKLSGYSYRLYLATKKLSSYVYLCFLMRMIDCPNCDSNVMEIDETPNIDGTRSFVRCKVCGFDIHFINPSA
jgi:hypothetical protein